MTLAQLTLSLSRFLEAHPELAEEKVADLKGSWIFVDARDVDLAAYLP